MPIVFSATNFNVTGQVISDWTFSNSIIPDAEFSWEIAKLAFNPDATWEIKSGINMYQGDTIKLVITEDPDNLVLSSFLELYTTDGDWADAYLNDQALGDDLSALRLNFTENKRVEGLDLLIMPTTLVVDNDSYDTFDYLYDLYEPLQFDNESGYLKVSMTDDLIFLEWRYYDEYALFFLPGVSKEEYIIEASYNLETGVLDKLVAEFSSTMAGSKASYKLILLNTESTQRAAINLVPYILLSAMIIMVITRKRGKK